MVKILENDLIMEDFRVILNHCKVHPGYHAITEVCQIIAARTLEVWHIRKEWVIYRCCTDVWKKPSIVLHSLEVREGP